MKNRQILSLALVVSVGAAFSTPLAASAGPPHVAPNEVGVLYHLDDAGPAKTDAQVAADLANAQAKTECLNLLRCGAIGTLKVRLGNSGEQVVAEREAAHTQPNWDASSRLGATPAASRANTNIARAASQT